jgi:hypothetical protein
MRWLQLPERVWLVQSERRHDKGGRNTPGDATRGHHCRCFFWGAPAPAAVPPPLLLLGSAVRFFVLSPSWPATHSRTKSLHTQKARGSMRSMSISMSSSPICGRRGSAVNTRQECEPSNDLQQSHGARRDGAVDGCETDIPLAKGTTHLLYARRAALVQDAHDLTQLLWFDQVDVLAEGLLLALRRGPAHQPQTNSQGNQQNKTSRLHTSSTIAVCTAASYRSLSVSSSGHLEIEKGNNGQSLRDGRQSGRPRPPNKAAEPDRQRMAIRKRVVTYLRPRGLPSSLQTTF